MLFSIVPLCMERRRFPNDRRFGNYWLTSQMKGMETCGSSHEISMRSLITQRNQEVKIAQIAPSHSFGPSYLDVIFSISYIPGIFFLGGEKGTLISSIVALTVLWQTTLGLISFQMGEITTWSLRAQTIDPSSPPLMQRRKSHTNSSDMTGDWETI